MTQSQSQDFFPHTVRTEKEALSFVKKLTAISVSTILYYRNMFPEQDYGTRNQGHEVLHILDRNASSESAKRIVDLVASTFTAIDLKVLHCIVIGIVNDPNKPDHFLESYCIKIKYSKQNNSSINCGSELTDEAMRLLKELRRRAEKVKRLDTDLYFTMRLMYTDSEAGYKPRGFRTCDSDKFSITGRDQREWDCGKVESPFARFSLRIEMGTSDLNE